MPQFSVTFELVDAYGRTSRKSYETSPSMADFAGATAAAAALASDLAGLTEAEVLSYTVAQRTVYNDSVTTGANRDEGVTLVLRKEDNFKGVLKVPAPINAIFDAQGNVDITNAAVTAFVSNFLTGADFVFSDGEQACSLLSGKLDK